MSFPRCMQYVCTLVARLDQLFRPTIYTTSIGIAISIT